MQVIVEVGFFNDPELQHTWSALLYWRKRLIVPFLRFGALPTCLASADAIRPAIPLSPAQILQSGPVNLPFAPQSTLCMPHQHAHALETHAANISPRAGAVKGVTTCVESMLRPQSVLAAHRTSDRLQHLTAFVCRLLRARPGRS
jgi:hypothetical protein